MSNVDVPDIHDKVDDDDEDDEEEEFKKKVPH